MNHNSAKRPILAEFRTLFFIVLIVALLLAACNRAEPGPGPQATAVSQDVTPVAGPESSKTTTPEAAGGVTATNTPAPAPTPTIQPLDLPPVAVATSPERGQEQPLDAPIMVRFDQPMDKASTEAALSLIHI